MRLCLAAAYCIPCPPHLGFSNLTVHSAQGEIKKDPALGPFLGRAPFGGGTGWGWGCGAGAQSKEENILSACSSVLELWDLLGGGLGKVV